MILFRAVVLALFFTIIAGWVWLVRLFMDWAGPETRIFIGGFGLGLFAMQVIDRLDERYRARKR